MGSRVEAALTILVSLIGTALTKEQIAFVAGKLRVGVARALLLQLRESAVQCPYRSTALLGVTLFAGEFPNISLGNCALRVTLLLRIAFALFR